MRYISTRGQAAPRDFSDVLLAGLAEDGGLFMPENWPHFSPADWRAMRALPYHALAARIMQPFVGASIPFTVLEAICRDAYAGFGHPAVVPLVQLETHLFTQELFHGPTLAFKDMAMQVLGRLFDHVLTERDARVTIVGATSGDTGSAAIEACAGRDRIDIMILHPPDDHGSGAKRWQHRRGGNLRRLSGPGKSHVRRHHLPLRGASFGGQLHQLGPHRRPDTVLCRSRPRPGRAGPGGCVQRPNRQFRECLRRLGR
jgi:hypothetical protein